MKTTALSLLSCIILALHGYAQNRWDFLNPIPTTSELTSVQFISPDTGWISGHCRTIIQTTDGGETWIHQDAKDLDHIINYHFVNSQYGWMVGYKYTGDYVWGVPIKYGVLLKTENGGKYWRKLSDFGQFYPSISEVFFINRDVGWLVCTAPYDKNFNTLILNTTNGGEDWFIQDSVSLAIESLFFINSDTGWAVGGASDAFDVTILKTENGGTNWTYVSTGIKGVLESVYFSNADTGWAVGYQIILKTENGGLNWHKQNIPLERLPEFTDVHFIDSQNGFIAGWSPFLRTYDGGTNWIPEESHNSLSVFFVDSLIGWRVGFEGIIQKSVDGGDTWFNQDSLFAADEFIQIDFINEYTGWVISPGSIYRTDDGGHIWHLQKVIEYGYINHLYVVDNQTSYGVGYDFGDPSSLILKTSDGGSDWNRQSVDTGVELNSCSFINEHVGWIVGESGTILYTENGGENWISQHSGTDVDFTSVDFIDANLGWIASMKDTLLWTEDGGQHWYGTGDASRFYSIDFIDSLYGWGSGGYYFDDAKILNKPNNIAGASGHIMKTSDGGRTWESQLSTHSICGYVQFLNEKIGWAISDGLLYTDDGGVTWSKQPIPACGMRTVDFIDEYEGWVAGYGGLIMHTTQGGVTSTSDVKKNANNSGLNYVLSQNYPNPFNPATKITFTLPRPGQVTLKVYNTLGQKVSTILNSIMNAGTHNVTFNASTLPSGIYFYWIQVRDATEHVDKFSQVKKMILIK